MPRLSNLYNVLDTTTNIQILKDVEIKDVAAKIGIRPGKVSLYAWNGSLFNNRYCIEKAEMASQEWIDDWNNMRTAAKLIRTGHGRIVKKNGKKYVEAKL